MGQMVPMGVQPDPYYPYGAAQYPPELYYAPAPQQQPQGYKIHVGNLPLSITSEELAQAFSRYGPILDIKIIKKTPSGEPQIFKRMRRRAAAHVLLRLRGVRAPGIG